MQGEGGIYPANEAFLLELRALCQDFNALLIFDEVQCGMGVRLLVGARVLRRNADIMTLAKPLGGGLPMGATLLTQAVATDCQRRSR